MKCLEAAELAFGRESFWRRHARFELCRCFPPQLKIHQNPMIRPLAPKPNSAQRQIHLTINGQRQLLQKIIQLPPSPMAHIASHFSKVRHMDCSSPFDPVRNVPVNRSAQVRVRLNGQIKAGG